MDINELFNTPKLRQAYEFVQFTNKNIFLTGKAGTGKTTFLHRLKQLLTKRMIVVAPTGVAAINAGGVTIHSFFQFSFSPYIPNHYLETPLTSSKAENKKWQLRKNKIDIIRSLELLIIDEISMVRADLLDQIDASLRRYKDRNKVFGGVQLLMIGDVQQLAPIAKDDELALLKQFYPDIYFFHSKALQKAGYMGIELDHIFRQQDERFISILNKIRDNKMDKPAYELLQKRYQPNFAPDDNEGYITLTTHNYQANEINSEKLKALETPEFVFSADVQGNYPEQAYPTEFQLKLKEGSQVMFIKNDPSSEKEFYNGKVGIITEISDDQIRVQCKDDQHEIFVPKLEWQNIKYKIDKDSKEIVEEIEGVFIQYPLKTAWAITVHKSQGLTFDKVIIDTEQAFTHGQIYVALSRCKTLEGVVLRSLFNDRAIITSQQVDSFTQQIENNQPNDDTLTYSKQEFELELIQEMFTFESFAQSMGRAEYALKAVGTEEVMAFIRQFADIRHFYLKPINEVADKFRLQCRSLFAQNPILKENTHLLERIRKAASYFDEQLNTLKEQMDSISYKADNKLIHKAIKQLREEVREEFNIKLKGLELGKATFEPLRYLSIKSTATLNDKKNEHSTEANVIDEADMAASIHTELVNWRAETAETEGVELYRVLPYNAIKEIATLLPLDKKQLMKIKGVGRVKVQRYGVDILKIVNYYVEKEDLTPRLMDFEPPKKEKVDTKKLSNELYRAGKSIAEIAQERELKESTIYTHLAHYVEKGEVSVFDFVSKEDVAEISTFCTDKEDILLQEVKTFFNDKYDYQQLKLVIAHIKHSKQDDSI